jgi:putative ABC transport system substrate-binding protein
VRVRITRRSWLPALFLLVSSLLWTGSEATPEPGQRVAILLSAKVDVYGEAVRGFKQSLEHDIVAEYDMRGDFDRGRRILGEIETKVKPDLLLAVGVWALEVAVQESLDIPVVYTMVLNPPTVVGEQPRNITGASMNVPVERAFQVFRQLGPEIQRIGTVFNPVNTGYLLANAIRTARAQGLDLVAREARSAGEAVSALDSLLEEGIDALWILPDKTVLAPAVVKRMLLLSYRKGLPLLGLSRRQAEMGALLTLSFGSSEDIGRQAGELANRALAGRPPSSIPFTTARKVDLTVNLKTARKLGIELPQSVLAGAEDVIR